MNSKKWIIMLTAVVTTTFLSFKSRDFEIVKNLDIFYTLFREVNLFYVDETNPEKLVEKSIEGMLETLDPYTTYIPESEMEDFKFMTTGKYGGIGALIRRNDHFTVITDPYKDFPADKAGLKAGDVIIEIDGQSIKDKSAQEVSELLKGTPNTEVNLLIERPGSDEKIKKTIAREKISISGVPYYGKLDDKTGYIRISNFTQNVNEDVKNAVVDLKDRGVEGIVIDLRNNPGGLLIEAVEIANLFVPKGQEIVSTRGKVKQWDNVYKTQNQPLDTIIPLTVLVSRGSASASEIVAGALQDLDRAVIIGQKTFGKGLVQTTRPLSYNAQLKVTTAKYYIPSGRCIQALDYTHRNEDGSEGYVPDSLISEFETNAGRKVYDGGGVAPDVKTEQEQISNIAISLYTKSLIFDYATQYAIKHETIPAISEFEITTELYNDFKNFLSDKDYDYETNSDENLKALIESAKREKYYEKAKEEFEELELKLAHDKEKDLETFKDDIKKYLKDEIVGRYYYQDGRIRASIDNDETVFKAVEILQNKESYKSILDGSYNNYAAMVIK